MKLWEHLDNYDELIRRAVEGEKAVMEYLEGMEKEMTISKEKLKRWRLALSSLSAFLDDEGLIDTDLEDIILEITEMLDAAENGE